MSSEHFIKYLKNPKLLNEVTYEELSQMRDKYPYSHILHYLLFLKSQQSPADMAQHNKNASIFAVDNNKIFEEIKQFQELEQKPTEKHTMDDLFDLSDDDEIKETSATQNEVTPTNDSEDTKSLIPPTTTPKAQPRIIREQRYIPLDPSIYKTSNDDIVSKRIEDEEKKETIDPTPQKQEDDVIAKPTKNDVENDQSNVFFIDALINLDNNNDRIELISNKDAYKEITDAPIEASNEEVIQQIEETEIIRDGEHVDLTDEIIVVDAPEIPLEITNDDEDEIPVYPEITVAPSAESESDRQNETDDSIEINNVNSKDSLETKKSFDNWVRKKESEKEKKKSSKKKKKKKDKMPTNAKESLKETDIIASETLAELLVKQGRNKKAIKVYERLCLIFPQKSNYFAQIIKNLKEKS